MKTLYSTIKTVIVLLTGLQFLNAQDPFYPQIPEVDLELRLRVIPSKVDYLPPGPDGHIYVAIDLYNFSEEKVNHTIKLSIGEGIEKDSLSVYWETFATAMENDNRYTYEYDNMYIYDAYNNHNGDYVQPLGFLIAAFPSCLEPKCPSKTIYVGPIIITDVSRATFEAEIWKTILEPDDPVMRDIDSRIRSGVDTDGDGNFHHDPDDEDDGDGIDFSLPVVYEPLMQYCKQIEYEIVENPIQYSPDRSSSRVIPANCSEQVSNTAGGIGGSGDDCMIAADVPSPFPANPENPNGVFDFDFYIESIARFGEIDASGRKTVAGEYKLNYYVNSNDGSLFFKEEFFGGNFMAMHTRLGRIDGVIRKSDGQQVLYGWHRATNQLRAAIVDQTQTAAGLAGQQQFNVERFFRSMTAATEPLPGHLASRWGNVPGYTGKMPDMGGRESTVTIYMGTNPDINPIPTNTPLVGFLNGIFKDHVRENCNKLAVYTLMVTEDRGYIEVELQNIEARDFSYKGSPHFDGGAYKITTISGTPGSNAKVTFKDLEDQAWILQAEIDALVVQRRNCGVDDTACKDRINQLIEAKEQEIEDLKCQAACMAGMEEALDNCICN